jgi:hypothetical protein
MSARSMHASKTGAAALEDGLKDGSAGRRAAVDALEAELVAHADHNTALVPRKLRCACATCGAHVRARVGRTRVSGMCSVCGGHDLVPLDTSVGAGGVLANDQ